MLAEQRHGEERSITEPDHRVADAALVGPGLRDVGDLHRLAHLSGSPHESFALPERRGPERCDEFRVVMVRRSQLELICGFVILVDRAAVAARELARARDDHVEHRLDLERRADRPAHLSQGLELFDRARQFSRALLQLLEQADVLDGDHGLVGEGLEQRDLALREELRLGAAKVDHANR